MNTFLITHTDLDGISVLVLCKYFGISFKRVSTWNYEQINPDVICKYSDVLMVDLSVKEEEYLMLKQRGIDIRIYDHHSSSEYLSKYRGNIWTTEKCGAKLFYENYVKMLPMFKPDENVERYVELVDIFDRWQTHNPLWDRALNLQRLFSISKNFVTIGVDYIKRGLVFTPVQSSLILKSIDDENRQYNDSLKCMQIFKDTKGVSYAVFPIRKYASIICNRMLHEYPDLIYVIACFKTGRLSVRSRDNFDVTQLQGISGHKHAGGGYADASEMRNLMKGVALPYN